MSRSALRAYAPIALLALAAACRSGIGGPIDVRHPEQKQVLSDLDGGRGPRARLLAITSGVHHAGRGPGCSSQSEVGFACEGANPGDVYSVEVRLHVPERELKVGGRPGPEGGAPVISRTRLASLDEATKFVRGLRIDSCWSAAGTRASIRVTADGEPKPEWIVVEISDGGARWGIASGSDCAEVAAKGQPFAWN